MTQNPNLVRATLDLLILKALTWEPKHGYGISEWIETVTDGTLLLEEGTLYPALHRLHAKSLSVGAVEPDVRPGCLPRLCPHKRFYTSGSGTWP